MELLENYEEKKKEESLCVNFKVLVGSVHT